VNENNVRVQDPQWRFVPSDPGCGLKQFIQEAVGAASTCWSNFHRTDGVGVNAGVFMEQYALAIADAVYERANGEEGARLGMATTHTILHEVAARLRDNPVALEHLERLREALSNEEFAYRTVDSHE
jgi:hypothetical protein